MGSRPQLLRATTCNLKWSPLIRPRHEDVQKVLSALKAKSPNDRASIMIDCSHGNSSKNHLNQPKVASDIAGQVAAGEDGIIGIM